MLVCGFPTRVHFLPLSLLSFSIVALLEQSVDTVDVELSVDSKGKGNVMGKLIATGIGIPVDREYAGPLPMTVRPLMKRAPRAGEPGPRRRKMIEDKKRSLNESFRKGREE